jgi:hypothetical protein
VLLPERARAFRFHFGESSNTSRHTCDTNVFRFLSLTSVLRLLIPLVFFLSASPLRPRLHTRVRLSKIQFPPIQPVQSKHNSHSDASQLRMHAAKASRRASRTGLSSFDP